MSIFLLLVAIVIFILYVLAHGLMPAPLQSFLAPLVLLSILYVLSFAALTPIDPRGSAINGLAVLFLAAIVLYGGRRLWSRISAGKRRAP